MSFEIKTASRQQIKPLIGFYSESGCGKTMSSLLLARGLVGTKGRIVLIDTESGRGELYSDVIPNGYSTIPFSEPFTPMRYVEAIQEAEKAADVIIIDSISHEWEGIGGVLDMAVEIEEKSGKTGLHCWKKPKLEHNKMLRRMLQSPLPIIVCMRAKHKSRQTKDNGKTVIVKDDFTTPIQADDFIFEMTTHGEIMRDHTYRLTKPVHPSLDTCFPINAPISIATGEAIAKWCAGGKQSKSLKVLKSELWELTKSIHGGDKAQLDSWLKVEGILSDDETIASVTPDYLEEIIDKARVALNA